MTTELIVYGPVPMWWVMDNNRTDDVDPQPPDAPDAPLNWEYPSNVAWEHGWTSGWMAGYEAARQQQKETA